MNSLPWLARAIAVAGVVGTAALLVGAPGAAHADGRDPVAAEALFVAGRQAVQKGDYASACPRFAESQRLDPAAGTLLNLADCEEHVGHLATAWEAWQEAISLLPVDDNRRPGAKKRAALIEQRVPHLTIKLSADAPRDARVRRDAVELGDASLGIPMPVDAGSHEVHVTAPGHEDSSTTVTLGEGESRVLEVKPGGTVEQPPPPPPPPPPSTAPAATSGAARPSVSPAPVAAPEKPHRSRALFITGGVVGGIGIAGIVVGSVAGALAIGQKNVVQSDCDPARGGCSQQGLDAAHSGHSLATVSDVGFVAGAVLFAAGVGLVRWNWPVTVAPTPSGASLSWRGSF